MSYRDSKTRKLSPAVGSKYSQKAHSKAHLSPMSLSRFMVVFVPAHDMQALPAFRPRFPNGIHGYPDKSLL